MAMATHERARPAPGGRVPPQTLREALRGHPAGPEVAAALGALADRPPPAGVDPVGAGGAGALPGRGAQRGPGGRPPCCVTGPRGGGLRPLPVRLAASPLSRSRSTRGARRGGRDQGGSPAAG